MSESEIVFFVDAPATSTTGGRNSQDIGGGFGVKEPETKQKAVSLSQQKLTEYISQLTGVLEGVFQQVESQVGAKIALEEVELNVEVNAEGQLGILGTGGKAGGKGGITLKFKRR